MKSYYEFYIAKLDELIDDLIKHECDYGVHEAVECQLHVLFENRKHLMEMIADMKTV